MGLLKLMLTFTMMIAITGVAFAGKLEDQLFEAVKDGDAKKVHELIKRGADINAKDNYGMTPLHINQFEFAKQLIEKGADFYAKNKLGGTHYATVRDNTTEIAKQLIDKGADVNAKDNNAETPLFIAIIFNKIEIARLLIEKGADVNAKRDDGMTPLHFAANYGEIITAQILIENGADLNAKDKKGKTPYDIAADDEMKRLLKQENEVRKRTKNK